MHPAHAFSAAGPAMVAVVLGLQAGDAAAADLPDSLDQAVWIRVVAYQPNIDTLARIDTGSGAGIGTEFSFEALGLPRTRRLPALLLGARLGTAWRAEFEAFRLRRSGSTTIDATLVVDDTTFPISTVLASSFDSDVYRASAGYSFVKTPRLEVGGVFGLHVTSFELRLDAVSTTPGAPAAVGSERRSQTVPLPTLGVYAAAALAPGWQATGRADYFSLRHRGYDGRLLNAQANLIYRPSSRWGFGLGWRIDDYRIGAERADLRGRVEYRFKGPQAFVEAGF